jgi:hypothetical protein
LPYESFGRTRCRPVRETSGPSIATGRMKHPPIRYS